MSCRIFSGNSLSLRPAAGNVVRWCLMVWDGNVFDCNLSLSSVKINGMIENINDFDFLYEICTIYCRTLFRIQFEKFHMLLLGKPHLATARVQSEKFLSSENLTWCWVFKPGLALCRWLFTRSLLVALLPVFLLLLTHSLSCCCCSLLE